MGKNTDNSRHGRRPGVVIIAGALWALAVGSVARADLSPQQRSAIRAQHQADTLRAFEARDYQRAEDILESWTEKEPDNFVPWYNLACAHAMQGEVDESVGALERAVEWGFADLRTLRNDAHLAQVRGHDTYKKIIAAWPEILEARADARIERMRATYGDRYTVVKDPQRKLVYFSARDPVLFDRAREEIEQLTLWWDRNVHPIETDPEKWKTVPWVTVFLPTQNDYAKWARGQFGSGWRRIGGSYSNDDKMLAAMDLGATLRHEYWHVLHWRHMNSVNQRHPQWVMEGLCSLVEDVAKTDGAGMRPLVSWRTNISIRLASAGRLMPWDVLFELERREFVGTRPLAFYAQSRSIFFYLHTRGKLGEWYGHYIDTFDDDPSGQTAMVRAFDQPIEITEKDFQDWLRSLEQVPEDLEPGMATLPFDLEPGSGEGVLVASRGKTRGARSSGIRTRDIITEIDGNAIRDWNDLVRVLSDLSPGDSVSVSYLRRSAHGDATVTLVTYDEP